MTFSCVIGAVSVSVVNETAPSLIDQIDERSTLTLTILDKTGLLNFTKFQKVVIADDTLGTLFTGYVDQPSAVLLYPNAHRLWTIACVDQTSLLDRKSSRKNYPGQQWAGVIVVDQVQRYASGSGVFCNAALQWIELLSDWQAGIAGGTVAATNASDGNIGDGDLELALAGSVVSHTENSSAAFATGSSVNIDTSNNQLRLASYSGLSFRASAWSGYGSNIYHYRKIWSGSYTLLSTDYLWYSVWIDADSPQIKAGIDGIFSDNTDIRDAGLVDQNNLSAHPGADLSGFAEGQWYTRAIPLGSLAGKTLDLINLSFEGDSPGDYQAYFSNIFVGTSSGTVTQGIYTSSVNPGSASPPQLNAVRSSYGYGDVVLEATLIYLQSGTWMSAAHSCAAAGTLQSSQVYWSVVDATTGLSSPAGQLPDNTTLTLSSSYDSGVTFQVVSGQGASLPGLPVGATLTGRSIIIEVALAIAGNDPTASPALTVLSWTITPSFAANKSDLLQSWQSSGDFAAGTLTDVAYGAYQQASGAYLSGLAPTSTQRNWNDESLSNQTLFGDASGSQFISQNQLRLLNNGSAIENHIRFDFAGATWQNFTARIDMTVPVANGSSSFLYRTTGWQVHDNSWAYAVTLAQGASSTTLSLGHGSNSGSGSGSYANLVTYTFAAALTSSDSHALKIVVSGSSHMIYFDDYLVITATDSTYTAAGSFGVRYLNNTGGGHSASFDNFGAIASDGIYVPFGSYSGSQWISQSISLGTMTVGASMIQWNDVASTGAYFAVWASVSGAYAQCTNGQAIPGLAPGTVLSSAHIQLKVQMQGSSATDVPILTGLSIYVMPQFAASGTWTTAPLGWDSAARTNVVSGFGTASDGQAWGSPSGTGTTNLTSDNLMISNTAGDVDVQLGSRTGTDMAATVRFSLSASTISADIDLRYTDANNFYRLQVSTTAISVLAQIGGTSFPLASAAVALTTSTFYWLYFVVAGAGPVNFYGRVWRDGTDEPESWNIQITIF